MIYAFSIESSKFGTANGEQVRKHGDIGLAPARPLLFSIPKTPDISQNWLAVVVLGEFTRSKPLDFLLKNKKPFSAFSVFAHVDDIVEYVSRITYNRTMHNI